ncbi:MAG: flavin reductase (DIM6/NTAB) family NADH-FMN oxidoreductase RutF [Cognaticolwellia sp.]|jgi:flavin reductase (DIM6/NTAB) family NADH-FMN oxidoreductase RutF
MIKIYSQNDLLNLEKRFRGNFVNSLTGFKSANLIGTANQDGSTNLAIFSSVIHIGASPPLVGMISRPHSVPRHTLENILATKQFTINHVNSTIFKAAHQTSARYESQSEFDATGLTAEYLQGFKAPFVKEANIKIGLSLADIIDIKINNTKLIIGQIEWVALPENIVEMDGKLNIEMANSIAISGLNTYHQTEEMERLPYAKI